MKRLLLIALLCLISAGANSQGVLHVEGTFQVPHFGISFPMADTRVFATSLSEGMLADGFFIRVEPNAPRHCRSGVDTVFLSPHYRGQMMVWEVGEYSLLNPDTIALPIHFDPQIPFTNSFAIPTGAAWKSVNGGSNLRFARYEMKMDCICLGQRAVRIINAHARRQSQMVRIRKALVYVITRIEAAAPELQHGSAK
jgi:hypothetical protein